MTAPDLTGTQRFSGHVVGVLNQINPGSTDFQVKVLLANPQQQLRPGMVVKGRSRPFRCAASACRSPRSPTTTTTRVMTVQTDGTVKTVKVAEVGSDGTTSVVDGHRSGNAHRQQRPDERRRRREGFVPAVKFSLTRLFIKRPTLVFVIIALMTFAGVMSTATIVKELYPDVSQPTVTISVQYNGASVTEMRDNIVQPIEQNLAGTADLQTINSVVQQGQATITRDLRHQLGYRDGSGAHE